MAGFFSSKRHGADKRFAICSSLKKRGRLFLGRGKRRPAAGLSTLSPRDCIHWKKVRNAENLSRTEAGPCRPCPAKP
ncbi:hypothetical protein EBT11_03505 [bacterium]|nr:hypothetical protein [bacterium]